MEELVYLGIVAMDISHSCLVSSEAVPPMIISLINSTEPELAMYGNASRTCFLKREISKSVKSSGTYAEPTTPDVRVFFCVYVNRLVQKICYVNKVLSKFVGMFVYGLSWHFFVVYNKLHPFTIHTNKTNMKLYWFMSLETFNVMPMTFQEVWTVYQIMCNFICCYCKGPIPSRLESLVAHLRESIYMMHKLGILTVHSHI